ncbi:MAG: orotidine-5'-phosphate decarboxylase [Kiritimatiellaeota bacterium]|nr:orotidine-5'-phosphate decarboxylase [Kiritimatiellota bacterium]
MKNETNEIIVALDVPNAGEAAAAVREIGDAVSFYKVGLELYIADGPAVLDMLRSEGKRVFLDLKLCDIPRTVERAVASCLKFGAELLTIHAFGAKAMIESAAKAVSDAGSDCKILAVTVLTSIDQNDLSSIGVARPVAEQVEALGRLAIDSGAHGLVCSPQEVGALRKALGAAPILVTPGVRPAGGELGDQKRVATPAQAIRDGATHLVVGRPIMEAPDKRAAALAIRAEMTNSY